MACLDEVSVTLFLERRLARTATDEVEGHIDGCARCRRLVSALARGRAPEGSDDTDRIDRYVIQRSLGAGAMGIVYAAFDPLLDRTVALKLLHRGRTSSPESRGRLIREAQAMAKISSPHVISVYDVGTFDGQIYVAMELASGGTLRTWLAERPRSWREIVATMRAAGQGLAAAHSAGLVHRDFKPDNVLVDGDRVRVADFGLATAPAVASTPAEPGEASRDSLTRTGALVGTPAYAPPEQLDGAPADARGDQFSFCVTFYEALYGTRPFVGATVGEVLQAIRAGDVRPPAGTAVPRWLRAAIVRGLAADPAARFRDMAALLDELDRHRSRTRVIVAAGGAIVAGVVAWRLLAPAGGPTCRFDRELDGTWDAPRRAALEAAVATSKAPYAAATLAEVERGLDDYTRAWIAMRGEACEATRVRGDQSERVLELRASCLDRRRASLDAAVASLIEAGPDGVAKAVYAVHGLEPVADCAAAAVRDAPAGPDDPAMRARVAAWERELASARSDLQLARYAASEATAAMVARDATAAGARTVAAEALLEQGHATERRGDLAHADTLYRDAALAAEVAHGDRIAAIARVDRIKVAVGRTRYDEAHEHELAAAAAVERAGSSAPLRRSLATSRGVLRAAEGKYEPALAEFKRALELAVQDRGLDTIELSRARNNVGACLMQLGRYKESAVELERVVDLRRRVLGASHPDVATAQVQLAETYESQGRDAEALPLLDQALATLEAALGRTHPKVATALTELAMAHAALGHLERALELHRRALAIEEPRGPSASLAWVHGNIADVLDQLGRRTEAIAEYRIALEIRRQVLGPDHPDTGQTFNNLGVVQLELARYRDALASFEQALAIESKAVGPDHIRLAPALINIGKAANQLHEPARALASLERAAKLLATEGEPTTRAECDLELAIALWDTGGDRARARALVTGARTVLAADPNRKDDLARLDRWLAEHR